MTNASKITVSLEWAKRLAKAGWRQETAFVWWYTEAMSTDVKYFPDVDWEKRENKLQLFEKRMIDSGRHTFAPTAEEILRRLPDFKLQRIVHTWVIQIIFDPLHGRTETSESLANAAAAMYCYLSENNLLPPTP